MASLFFCWICFNCFSIDYVFPFFFYFLLEAFWTLMFQAFWLIRFWYSLTEWGYFELCWHSEVFFDGGSMVYLLANLFKISVKGLLFYLFVIPIPPFGLLESYYVNLFDVIGSNKFKHWIREVFAPFGVHFLLATLNKTVWALELFFRS